MSDIPQINSGWKMDKGISEGNFIKVVYDYLVSMPIGGSPFTSEEKEGFARLALSMHKLYWQKCHRDCMTKLISEMNEQYNTYQHQ